MSSKPRAAVSQSPRNTLECAERDGELTTASTRAKLFEQRFQVLVEALVKPRLEQYALDLVLLECSAPVHASQVRARGGVAAKP